MRLEFRTTILIILGTILKLIWLACNTSSDFRDENLKCILWNVENSKLYQNILKLN